MKLGKSEGIWLGAALSVGNKDGAALERSVGEIDGKMEGVILGIDDGRLVGDSVSSNCLHTWLLQTRSPIH